MEKKKLLSGQVSNKKYYCAYGIIFVVLLALHVFGGLPLGIEIGRQDFCGPDSTTSVTIFLVINFFCIVAAMIAVNIITRRRDNTIRFKRLFLIVICLFCLFVPIVYKHIEGGIFPRNINVFLSIFGAMRSGGFTI